ncbi:PREDICTED: nose resistant to fluoxetine protein 6-like [Vollenhovia emeryi]|uniref:nose resistant to fluoxetine protein 6-like n=1 Tax=Vollenhovia emeryi TaxID=411798 RepID=UPI0005F44631|nr:PREDICTED: nose resistant to fluoxetine protein 6-like [Vollenhovia emeryi]
MLVTGVLQWHIALFIVCIKFSTLCFAHKLKLINSATETVPAYTVAGKYDFLKSTTCGEQLKIFRDAVDQRILWSLKVLESSGRFKPGFLYGNNYWLGSRSQCIDTMNTNPLQILEQKMLNNILYHDPQRFPPFKINYFAAHIRHNSTLQYHTYVNNEDVITLGLCLPASCTIQNLNSILESVLHDRSIFIDDLNSTNLQLIRIKDFKKDNKSLSYGALGFFSVVLIVFLMAIIGTVYDIIWYQKLAKGNERTNTNRSRNYMSQQVEIIFNLPLYPENNMGKILRCFSVYSNTKNIFNTKLEAGTIPVIHGLKVLSMYGLIVFHTLYFSWDTLDNKAEVWRFLEDHMYLMDIVVLGVEVFFLSSGCFITYSYLRQQPSAKKELQNYRQKIIYLLTHTTKRFIRLTPAYMIVIGLSQLSSDWFDKTSQFYMYERSHETCPKHLWINLLYINNLFPFNDMCLSWSWYLANDMQYYILATMLLIFSTVYFYGAVTILSVLLIGSAILSGYISYVHKYTLMLTELAELMHVIYTPPWMRINPYIIGMIVGYVLAKLNNTLVLKRKIIMLCWLLASVCIIGVLFVFYKRRPSVLASAIYVALHKIILAIGIAWIVIACSTNHGGIVNQLLSFKGWIPFSRLTYCAYLLNPIVIRSINFYSDTSTHFECLSLVILSVAYTAIIYCCSYILSVTVEIPCILLMREYAPWRKNILQ